MKGNGEALIDLPAEPAPIAAGSVRVLWPKDLPVKWKAFGKGIAPVESDWNGYRILTQSHPLVKQEAMPEDAPRRLRRPPGLELSPSASGADLSRTTSPPSSQERRVGKEGVRQCRSRSEPYT